jgi:colanic acid/amylovoran biosynthesis protein
MTNILLINIHSACNIGDDALRLVTLSQLKQHFPMSRISQAMDDPKPESDQEFVVGSLFSWVKPTGESGQSEWRYGRLIWLLPATLIPGLTYHFLGKAIMTFTPRQLHPLLMEFIHANLVVSTAGGFLYSSGIGLVYLISLYTIGLSILFKKPLYFFPQSYGPLKRSWERFLLSSILSRARVVMAREEISYKLILSLPSKPRQCFLLPDPAFSFQELPSQSGMEWLCVNGIPAGSGTPLLGITVVNWGAESRDFHGQDRYEKAITAAAREFIHRMDGKVIFFIQVWGPSASQDDRTPTRRVFNSLQDCTEHILFIQDILPPDMLKGIMGNMDIFIGTRMHSNIFALSQGVPTIAIAYQHKTKGIMHMLGQDRWIIDIQAFEEQSLTDLMLNLWEVRNTVRSEIKTALVPILLDSARPGAIVAADFKEILHKADEIRENSPR